MPDVGFIDTYELLKLLLVTNRTIQRWRKSGRLPYSRLGGKYYYRADIILNSFKMKTGSPFAPVEVDPVDLVVSVDPIVPVVPVEVEYPPPLVEKLESDGIEMKCKTCPLLLLLIS